MSSVRMSTCFRITIKLREDTQFNSDSSTCTTLYQCAISTMGSTFPRQRLLYNIIIVEAKDCKVGQAKCYWKCMT